MTPYNYVETTSYTVKKRNANEHPDKFFTHHEVFSSTMGCILTPLNGLECPNDNPRDVGCFVTHLRVGMNISKLDYSVSLISLEMLGTCVGVCACLAMSGNEQML